MVSGKHSISILNDSIQNEYNSACCSIQKQSNIKDNIMMGNNEIELSFDNKEDGDFSLMKNETMSTNSIVSMDDSSCSSMGISVEMQPTIQGEGTDYININHVKENLKNEQRKPSVSELATERLISKGMERDKRIALLRKEYHKHQPKLVLEADSGKFSLDNDDIPRLGEPPVSGFTGDRLILKGMERDKRLTLLRKEYQNYQSKPKLIFANRQESKGIDTSKVSKTQQLYALSKPKQGDGKKRRKAIEKAIAKANKVWDHPKEKISIEDSTRLYYMGMRQLISREQRRIESSE